MFRPENALEEALLVAARTRTREPLLAALAEADVYVPVAEATRPENGELPLPTLADDGSVPVFSSAAQLFRFAPDGTPCLRLQGRALASQWPSGRSLALNPGGDLGVVLSAEEVESVRDAPAAPAPGYIIGEPATEPVALLEAVRHALERLPEVRAAYRGLLLRRDGEQGEPVVGLELESGADAEPVVLAVLRAGSEESLAVLPIAAGDEHPIARFLLERTQPFYVREAP